ncbi:septum formation initiator family protein [Breoghania sp. L-A4]|uniref:FtsB family cell division protein n=1 Tax=Breoghania sp. L-A4 TaxID=2304600 RepID=UPI000E35C5A9|nr:septum formation initiator family protein [Breoghania sp. L-A4]AXS40496.1 septum formation initiator family protein [Breoghania sp. L-A4]
MYTRQRKKSVVRRLFFPVLTIAILGYFSFHALNGEYGLIARARLDTKTARLQAELDELKQARLKLERRVVLLRPSSLDPDMIDERARASLNLVHRDEITILRAASQQN